jgi:predicted  nucleic acid-binding Zn-ribbon protein
VDQTLECLISLQKSDLDRIAHVQTRDELKLRLKQLESLLERGHRELSEKQEKLASAESFYRAKSLELKTEVERAKEAKAKLNNVTKQKEFLANQKEVEYLKKSNAKKEEEIVNLMEAIEEYKAGISENEERIQKLEQECKDEREANATQLTKLEKDIAALETSRAKLTGGIKGSILKRYERILKAREGQAVVTVSTSGVCSGCNMRILAQQVQVLMKSKTYGNCPSCQRFIYVDEEECVAVEAE